MHPLGGFFSALDADSEGEEGKFYIWNKGVIKSLLGEEADLFCRYFSITESGNWEGKNILMVHTPLEAFAREQNIDPNFLKTVIQNGKEKLLQKRAERVRPGLDDKVLLGWNALMNTAYCHAYSATGNEHYKEVAVRNMQFLLHHFKAGDNLLHHTWKEGMAKYPAFLDDYSYLIMTLTQLAQVTADFTWLDKAGALTQTVLDGFTDPDTALFFFTHADQTDVLLRKKEVYDSATPSGNSIMGLNLYQLSILLDRPEWKERAEQMMAAFGTIAIKYPTSFGVWLGLLFQMVNGTRELAIVGPDYAAFQKQVLSRYLPHTLLMASSAPIEKYPLLRDKKVDVKTLVFLCENYACRKPVTTLQELETLISTDN